MMSDNIMPPIEEEEEENFVMTALFTAIEEGNLNGLQELLDSAPNYDINQTNKHGETALHMSAYAGNVEILKHLQTRGIVLNKTDKHGDGAIYWAARQGHLDTIKYLKEEGLTLNTQNKAGEAAIHVAARYGHINVIEYLCNEGADINVQDKQGETVLHAVAWHGLPPSLVALLCTKGSKVNTQNKENETPIHSAASRGYLDIVKVLMQFGANINSTDKKGSTALHLACRRHHTGIAMLLLHAGCDMDVKDTLNETSLHPAAKDGLLPVVQTMCAFGCTVDTVNKSGYTPLHLSARSGHTEVTRCLLLSGSEPDLPNKDGTSSEIMALAQGHNDVAELLSKMKPEKRDMCINQLMPTNQTLGRIKVKLFGNSSVGKTTLIDSLKCGYFGSFFRKARLQNSNSISTNAKGTENGSVRTASLPTQLSYEVTNESYTQGIDVQQVNLTGAGDLSLWEFSGYEPYHMLYDHFIGDPNCMHMVLFNLEDTEDVQLSQVLFWLNFVKARIAPMEPIARGGRHPWPAKIVLVATNADKVNCLRTTKGEFTSPEADILLATVREKFEMDFDISDRVFVVDCHLAMSPELKALRSHLADLKMEIIQRLPSSNGFLDATVVALPNWRKALPNCPIVAWPSFIEYVRAKVNMLASEAHLKELMCQLQLIGEVIYIETEHEKDMVVLNPKWLCCDIIGRLLSHDHIFHSRPTGCFSVDDFQLIFPDCDPTDVLQILEALEVCTRCEIDGDVEYEFPSLNFVETLSGLWEKENKRVPNPVYGGVRVCSPRGMTNQLLHLFPRIQVHLRHNLQQEDSGLDCDLYQWYHGSKYCRGNMECLLTLEQKEQVIELKCRGPEELKSQLFYFMEEISDIVENFLEDSCPGICLERHLLSVSHLKEYKDVPYGYPPKDVILAQAAGKTSIALDDDKNEELNDLICFGSDEVRSALTLGVELHISHLSLHTRQKMSSLLDGADPMGRDWCMLGVLLGLTEDLPRVDHEKAQALSKTDRILELWSRDPKATISVLLGKLEELQREDVKDALLTSAPLYRIFQEDRPREQLDSNMNKEKPEALSSENNLSTSSASR